MSLGSCHTITINSNQFQAISKKRIHSQFECVHKMLLGIVRHCLIHYSSATKVVL